MRLVPAATGLVAGCFLFLGCMPKKQASTTPAEKPRPTFRASRLRSFTDTFAVTTVADSPQNLWVGSVHGLVRWDLSSPPRYTVIGAKEGLPSERVAGVAVDAQ